jgi:hypothetical protein
MIVSLLIIYVTLIAQTAVPPSDGNGTENDPYQIETLENLFWISENENEWDKYYVQTENINASDTENWFEGQGWSPIGNSQEHFSGNYDGQGYVIYELHINRPESSLIGLFGRLHNGTIRNLGLEEANILGNLSVGALAGILSSNSTILNCYSTGIVNGIGGEGIGVTGDTGGLVGFMSWNSRIEYSYSSCTVIGVNSVGGLLGRSQHHISEIINSYSIGNVIGKDFVGGLVGINGNSIITESFSSGNIEGENNIGGLVGYNVLVGKISDTYATGNVNGIENVGGLVGWNGTDSSIMNSYSIGSVIGDDFVGGLIGKESNSETEYSYWDIDTSGQTNSAAGEGRNTEEMTYPYTDNTYVGWDFDNIWAADEDYTINNGYPYLQDQPLVSAEDDMVMKINQTRISNYPNPFNPDTTIRLELAEAGRIELSIYNIKGQKVRNLLDAHTEPGIFTCNWNGRDDNGRPVASGQYFIKLKQNDEVTVEKMMMVK